MTARELEAAVDRADRFSMQWAATPLDERLAMLSRARGVLLRRAEELARLIAMEQGKPLAEALASEIMVALGHLSYLTAEMPRMMNDAPRRPWSPFLSDRMARVVVSPRGLTSVISAWNMPFVVPFCQLASCVAVGNPAILRPSTATPLIALAIGEIFAESGVPPAALGVAVCRSEEAQPLVADPRVRLLLFTGSTAVGRELAAKGARQLCRVVLELGGKDPMIVFDDAPLERAARGAVWSAFFNAGQACSSTERVYVQRGIFSRFTARVVELTRELVTGDPLDPETDIGPMTTEEGVVKVESQIRDALAKGARLLTGGGRVGGSGRLFAPTVLADVTSDMAVMSEETFGPLLPIMAFDAEDEAVALANASEYGLTASVWTRDPARARRVEGDLHAGTVTCNDANFTFSEATAPWGGVKATGLGRTHGPEGLAELVDVKYISEDWSDRDRNFWWYPYNRKQVAFLHTSMRALHAATLAARGAAFVGLTPWLPALARSASLTALMGRLPDMLGQ